MAGLVYLSVGLFFIVYVIKKTFSLEYYRPLIIPTAVILFTLCLIPQSLMASINLEGEIYRKYSWLVTFILPIIILLLAKLVKRKKEGGKRYEKV
ncbi:MAG: hypothetical protein BWY74_02744 [Firmicutes bacterium ADurb.Bin419]|nr:MAG: hypothetical protein BWY74_02744 [Firmicutes bacterium ADurb.Bin419]